MANIMDYLSWRGDLPFSADGFNEVDNYILSKIGCPDFTGIVPENEQSISITDAVRTYYEKNGDSGSYFGVLASSSIGPMIRKLPETVRFRSLKLSGFVLKLETASTEQFSALTLLLPDGTAYISFRGTDDTLLGWKENMLLSVTNEIPSQKDALQYLTWASGIYSGPLIVGGHSKGGNLAVYAASMAGEEIQNRIITVYNNDGPGFSEEFLQSDGYQRIRPKLHTLLPQYSMIGMLLLREKNVTIVSSGRPGPAAHDGFEWEVIGPSFVKCENFSRGSLAFEESMRAVLDGMDLSTRKQFIEELFDTLSSTGAVTLTDITELQTRKALELYRDVYHQPEVHKFLNSLLEMMLKDYAGIPLSTVRFAEKLTRQILSPGARDSSEHTPQE